MKTGGDFLVQKTSPVHNGQVFLNDPIRIDFSNRVDLDSANFDAITFQAFDGAGTPLSERVTGTFSLAASDQVDGKDRRLLFEPKFASNDTFDDGGFRAGRSYTLQLVGGAAINRATLRDSSGRALDRPSSFSFSTVEGTLPGQLYRNPLAGGPRRAASDGLSVSHTSDLRKVPINLQGAPPLEVRLRFDQALSPHRTNLPLALDTDPLVRDPSARGRVFLEYDDSERGASTWIPADVELEQNDRHGALLVLRPIGVLPNDAEIRVVVEASVEDIAGESNVGEPAYNRVFGTFRTEAAYGQQFDAVVETFDSDAAIDFRAVFAEPLAEVGPGYLQAGFAFEGRQTSLEFEPTARDVVLNTSFTQVVPKDGLAFNVSGGVFHFHNVHIPQGVSVKGQGPNPMVWLCTGDFRVDGDLSVRGGDGSRVNTLNSANFPKAGGIGVCGGGNGGSGSPSGTARDERGGNGSGPLQVPGLGGGGGRLACTAGCGTGNNGGGSGGGGGTLATQGDPHYRAPATLGTAFQQRRGAGGMGCSGTSGNRTGVLPGGEPAPAVFRDLRQDNDFWGAGIDVRANLRVAGELRAPVGGGGGGGGGDRSTNNSCTINDPAFANDNSGGGGGGGGGVLIVKALGEIVVGSTGHISADGGNGGGGEQAGSCNQGGGGGGGAGGMVVLMSARRIVLHAHGSATRWNYAQNDYDFAISADGGVCTTGTFQGPQIRAKYPASGTAMTVGSVYDDNPLGGLGGMGIVQLMAPPGDNSLDGTNTRLDDNIVVFRNGFEQIGTAKQSILAWRGFAGPNGEFVDDAGALTNIGDDEGDIRPAPILLPVPFGDRSRLRSKWLDTGASQRRALTAADGQPRALLVGNGAEPGPTWSFAGLSQDGLEPGFLAYEASGPGAVRIAFPVAIAPVAIAGIESGVTYLGAPAHRITLAEPVLGDLPNRYSHYEAELLLESGESPGGFRIFTHDASTLLVDAAAGPLPTTATRLQVRAKFFRVETNGSDGLGPVRVPAGSSTAAPIANVRLGFAFHQDPRIGAAGRYPADPQRFVTDLGEAGLQAWIAQHGAPRYVQWDVLFDLSFTPPGTASLGIAPNQPRPELHALRIPFRF